MVQRCPRETDKEVDTMIAETFTNSYANYTELPNADYLPKWAVDEGLYNCEHVWNRFRFDVAMDKILSIWK